MSAATRRAHDARATRHGDRRYRPPMWPRMSTTSRSWSATSRIAPTMQRGFSSSAASCWRHPGRTRRPFSCRRADTATGSGVLHTLLQAAGGSRSQHDAHRVAAVAAQTLGLRVLHSISRVTPTTTIFATRWPNSRQRQLAVSRSWCVPEGGRVSELPRIRRIPRRGSAAATLTVPGDKSVSHRALMLGGIAGRHDPRHRLPAGRRLPRNADRDARDGRQGRPRCRRPKFSVEGVGLDGLEAPGSTSTWAIPAPGCVFMTGLLGGAVVRFQLLVGDESLSGRPMGRVIKPLGAPWARALEPGRRQTAARDTRVDSRCGN